MAIMDYFLRFRPGEGDKNTLFAKTYTPLGREANYFIVALIIISLLVMVLASMPFIENKYILWIWVANYLINSIFCFEYVYRFSCSTHKFEFSFRLLNIFHLLSFLLFFIFSLVFGVGDYSILAVFRVFALISIFELLERNPVISKIYYGIKEHKSDYLTVIILAGIMLLFLSVIAYYFEYNWGDRKDFYSLPHTFWWSIVTMTTTGYGDVIPITIAGKCVAIILMILGPILTAIIGAITVLVFFNNIEK